VAATELLNATKINPKGAQQTLANHNPHISPKTKTSPKLPFYMVEDDNSHTVQLFLLFSFDSHALCSYYSFVVMSEESASDQLSHLPGSTTSMAGPPQGHEATAHDSEKSMGKRTSDVASPPPDGGFSAWLQVFASWVLIFNAWGKCEGWHSLLHMPVLCEAYICMT